jgi:hypothetical protein
MFLQQLKEKKKKEYIFREQTLIWKDVINNEYKFYVSVILETYGQHNRFDYSAFNYGLLSKDQDINVIINICRMIPKETQIQQNRYIIDYDIWNSVYNTYKMKLKNVF